MSTTIALFFAFLVAIGPMSAAVTKAVDAVRDRFDPDHSWNGSVWNVLAFVFGIALAIGFKYNLAGATVHSVPALSTVSLAGVLGEVLTGLGIGGWAGYLHDHLNKA